MKQLTFVAIREIRVLKARETFDSLLKRIKIGDEKWIFYNKVGQQTIVEQKK